MKRRFLLLLAAAGIIATAFLLFREYARRPARNIGVLLPPDTALLLHIQDAEKSLAGVQRTDLYQLSREPPVQQFLRGAFDVAWERSRWAIACQQAASLRLGQVFIALIPGNPARLVGGFEFAARESTARPLVAQWQDQLVANGQHRSLMYNGHRLDVVANGSFRLCSAFLERRWVFATAIEELERLLDRIDGRGSARSLADEKNFTAALEEMPRDYALFLYAQPKRIDVARVFARARLPFPDQLLGLLNRSEAVAHALRFEGEKMREVDFALTPQVAEGDLTRNTLALASADTLIYGAARVNFRRQLGGVADSKRLAGAQLTPEDLDYVGGEISLLLDWPARGQMPSLLLAAPVRDANRARSMLDSFVNAGTWAVEANSRPRVYRRVGAGPLMPSLTLSGDLLALGANVPNLPRALAPQPNGLDASAKFRDNSRLVPEPRQLFAWIDLPGLYSRLDATLRPMLQLLGAFLPRTAERFDRAKLPPNALVVKHLSPVVASGGYVNGGYRVESVGSITLDQTVALTALGYARFRALQAHAHAAEGRVPTVAP